MHFLYMGNHRDFAALSLQTVQRVHGQLQGFRIEAAEALVDEQRFDFQRARRH
ncbi:hypothetical protein D3C84_1274890 [compost metagenome]